MFNKDNLSAYVALNSKEWAVKSVSGAKTASLLIKAGSVQTGIKKKEKVLKANVGVTLQSAESCGRTAIGSTTLSDKEIEVSYISSKENYCYKDLVGTYGSFLLQVGSQPDQDIDSAFGSFLIAEKIKAINSKMEVLLWKGDKSLTSNADLKWIDGIIDQVKSTTHIDASYTSGTTSLIKKLQQGYLRMPVHIRNQEDFRIFIGEDMMAEYTIEVDDKNYFNKEGQTILRGTTAILEAVPGLNGSNEIYFLRLSNLKLGLDGTENEAEKSSFKYSMETELFYNDMFWSIGVCVIYPEEVGIGNITIPATTTTTTTQAP